VEANESELRGTKANQAKRKQKESEMKANKVKREQTKWNESKQRGIHANQVKWKQKEGKTKANKVQRKQTKSKTNANKMKRVAIQSSNEISPPFPLDAVLLAFHKGVAAPQWINQGQDWPVTLKNIQSTLGNIQSTLGNIQSGSNERAVTLTWPPYLWSTFVNFGFCVSLSRHLMLCT
jgi:hypothetical protein